MEASYEDAPEDRFSIRDLEYALPEALIAQAPLPDRDASRLLVVDRATKTMRDDCIRTLPDLLEPGDLIVLNDTRVLPARLTLRRPTGRRLEGLFLREEQDGVWSVLLQGSRRLRRGEHLYTRCWELLLKLLDYAGEGIWRVAPVPHPMEEGRFPRETPRILERIGTTPLPPYIHRGEDDPEIEAHDRHRYQTIYARRAGAVAAPTAGLHLTEALLERIRARGIEITFVTLHVGPGTFRPIAAHTMQEHRMHEEWYEVGDEAAETINRCRRRGGRIVAVGTTSVRTLESVAVDTPQGLQARAASGWTRLFIYPPYRFRLVDVLLTNFHLPRSTLLALVMAFAGVELIRRAYRHAVEERYRFYSYGDAMLIL